MRRIVQFCAAAMAMFAAPLAAEPAAVDGLHLGQYGRLAEQAGARFTPNWRLLDPGPFAIGGRPVAGERTAGLAVVFEDGALQLLLARTADDRAGAQPLAMAFVLPDANGGPARLHRLTARTGQGETDLFLCDVPKCQPRGPTFVVSLSDRFLAVVRNAFEIRAYYWLDGNRTETYRQFAFPVSNRDPAAAAAGAQALAAVERGWRPERDGFEPGYRAYLQATGWAALAAAQKEPEAGVDAGLACVALLDAAAAPSTRFPYRWAGVDGAAMTAARDRHLTRLEKALGKKALAARLAEPATAPETDAYGRFRQTALKRTLDCVYGAKALDEDLAAARERYPDVAE